MNRDPNTDSNTGKIAYQVPVYAQPMQPNHPSHGFKGFCKRHAFRPGRTLVILLLIAVFVGSFGFFGITAMTTVTSRTMEFGLKDIGELATQAGYYTNVQVISGSREMFGIAIPLTEKKYIFSYDGIIKAGYDFSEIKIDVDAIRKEIRVRLPEPRILSNEIDENSFELLDESRNIFNSLKPGDMNESLSALKRESEEKAIKNGIFDSARNNAELLIQQFLSGSYDLSSYRLVFE